MTNTNELATLESSALQEQGTLAANLAERFARFIDASPKTQQTYIRALRQMFKYFADNNITRPQREDVLAYRDFLTASGHKPTTVSSYLEATRLFFQWTEAEHLYPNVCGHIKAPRLDKGHRKDYLTSRQVKAILASIDRSTLVGLRDFAMIALMVCDGLRCIEVSRATIGDLRTVGDASVLFIMGKGKSEKNDYVKLSEPVEAAIRQYLAVRKESDPAAPLFASTSNNSQGKAMSTRSVSGIVKARMQEAGYDSDRLTAHSLRHTACTLALLNGMKLENVQQFARHASMSTTMIYVHQLDVAQNPCSEAVSNAIF